MSVEQTIKTEIDADSLSRGYSGMSDQAVADDLNTKYRPVKDVPRADILKYLLQAMKWKGLKESTTSVAISAVRAFEESDFETIDLDDSANIAMIDLLVTATLLTSDDKTAILALRDDRQTRAAELGLGKVLAGYVTRARAL